MVGTQVFDGERLRLAREGGAHEVGCAAGLGAGGADVAPQHERVSLLLQRLQNTMSRREERAAQRLADATAQLELLNPRRTLQRGYAAVLDGKGQPVRDPRKLHRGQQVTMHLADGAADVGIGEVQVRLDDTF